MYNEAIVTDLNALSEKDINHDIDSLWMQVDNQDFSDEMNCVRCLYRVLANSYKMSSYSEAINALLQIGLKRFEMDLALLTHPISDQVHELQAFAGHDGAFYLGQHLSVNINLCHQVHETKKLLSVLDVNGAIATEFSSSVNTANGLSNNFGLEYSGYSVGSYLGFPVSLRNEKTGVLSFFDEDVKTEAFTQDDLSILELISEGVACMVELQATQSQSKKSDLAMFTSGSIKSLEDYLDQAKLPNLIGVASRVVEALEKRIGDSSLSIGCIADELNLSKRTLQRRLYQHDISFAELRDQVRFHYSIDYLIRQHMSIDAISVCLDFSDRTSFTNAFKRWTGLSPSTFRKIFRDYV